MRSWLSIQLPTAYATESANAWQTRHPALGARIAAASAWLTGRGQLNQVLLAEGDSTGVLLRHVQAGIGEEVRGATVVPVRALLALAEGGFAVEKVIDGEQTRLIGVELGAFDDGMVEIVSGAIAPGDDVVVPQ